MEFCDLKTQYQNLKPEIDSGIQKVLEHGKFILGPEVSELEKRLSDYVGVRHTITCGNWTDGLTISLMALDIQPGDEVITTPFSFIATVESILVLGAVPVFVDIDPKTYNLDAALLEKKIGPKTKAILPVSLYGQCADFDAINKIAGKHSIPVLEDGAQSFGAAYRGKKSGNLSLLGGTSFFPSKPLGCYGDGGACFTNDDQLAEKLKEIRAHGQRKRYEHHRLGVNSRLDTIQAAILIEKLKVFDDELEKRQSAADIYTELLSEVVDVPKLAADCTSAWAQYTIEVDNRDQLREHLSQNSIPTAVHYPKPLHRQPVMHIYDIPEGSFPHSERAAERVLSLPMHPYLSLADQERIVGCIREFYESRKIATG